MNNYLQQFSELIAKSAMDNTYKMAWARAIIESCVSRPDRHLVRFSELSRLMFKYYWNQTIFFNLQQGPALNRKPEIHAMVLEAVQLYRKKYGSPAKTFIRIQDKVEVPTDKIGRIIAQDVCRRFLNLNKQVVRIYDYDLDKRVIEIREPAIISAHSDLLFQLVNYRWTQKLEDIDGSPRIANKVKGVDREGSPKRSSLASFKRFLDEENPARECFLTSASIEEKELSIDHVIPWSYMYSDDLWNLVYVGRKENSAKSNLLPTEDEISKLERRNRALLEKLRQKNITGARVDELEIAIERDYVRQHWIGCKG